MAPEKETMMMLKVDLDCARCYKKVKKLLCSIEQVKDQTYDKNQNTVKIKVVGYCPERIKNKICCKGGKTIQEIKIMDPPTKTAPEPAKPQTPKEREEKPRKEDPPRKTCCSDCREGRTTGPCYTRCGYGYWYGAPPPSLPPPPPPPPPPRGWVYYDGCPPCGYEYRPGGYYYVNYEYPSACVIM